MGLEGHHCAGTHTSRVEVRRAGHHADPVERRCATFRIFSTFLTRRTQRLCTRPAAIKRLGTHDCRIAATAIVSGFTVVTCNTRHFQPIPDVQVEDWSL